MDERQSQNEANGRVAEAARSTTAMSKSFSSDLSSDLRIGSPLLRHQHEVVDQQKVTIP